MTLPTKRIHYFDAIRTYAVLLGIVVHAAAGYVVVPIPQWPHFSDHGSVLFNFIVTVIHIFRVPVFFFVAGFFAYDLWSRVVAAQFVINRCKRILLPLVLCCLVFNAPYLLVNIYLHKIATISDVLRIFSNLSYTWFLEYLVIFYLLFFLASYLSAIKHLNYLARKVLQTKSHVLILTVMLFLALYENHSIYLPIKLSIVPNLWLLLFYGSYFLLGVILAINTDLMVSFFRWRWRYFIVAFATLGLFFALSIKELWEYQLLIVLLYSYTSFLLFHCFMAMCIHFFQKPISIHRYVADASYWIYLIQVYLILLLQSELENFGNVFLQFAATSLITLLISLFSYDLFFRRRGKAVITEALS